jgi:hypothetical protein
MGQGDARHLELTWAHAFPDAFLCQPVFAPLREKLGIVTRAFFAQGDLADTAILVDFHDTLEAGLRAAGLKGEDVAEDDDFTEEDADDTISAPDENEDTGDGERTATQASFPVNKTDKDSLREGVMYMGQSIGDVNLAAPS